MNVAAARESSGFLSSVISVFAEINVTVALCQAHFPGSISSGNLCEILPAGFENRWQIRLFEQLPRWFIQIDDPQLASRPSKQTRSLTHQVQLFGQDEEQPAKAACPSQRRFGSLEMHPARPLKGLRGRCWRVTLERWAGTAPLETGDYGNPFCASRAKQKKGSRVRLPFLPRIRSAGLKLRNKT
jgi:hypothetical protein